MHRSALFTVAGLATSAIAGYSIKEDFMSGSFFDHFDFINQPDPTNGFVNYVDGGTASAKGYVNTNNGAYIGVDSTNVASDPGRDSVRLSSKSQFDESLIVLDLAHMPTGMGAWPAFWTFGPGWPNQGEIDIIEGVNDQSTNFMTLHLGNPSCKMESKGSASLDPFSTDCYAYDNGNEGCSYHDTDTSSYGSGFNQAQGGVFAMEYTGDVVSIWKWANGASPADALGDSPNPSGWGPPRAQWLSTANGGCDLKTAIRNQNIVFDTTFCGDWAGNVFNGGPGACVDFVRNNPSAFSDTFWQVRGLKVYTTDGQAAAPSSAAPTSQAAAPTTSEAAAPTTTTDAPPPPPPTTTTDAAVPTTTTDAVVTTTTSDAPPPPPATTTTDAAVPTTTTDLGSTSTDLTPTPTTTTDAAAPTTTTNSTSVTSTSDAAVPTTTTDVSSIPSTTDTGAAPTTTADISSTPPSSTPNPTTTTTPTSSVSSNPTPRPTKSHHKHHHHSHHSKPTASATMPGGQPIPTPSATAPSQSIPAVSTTVPAGSIPSDAPWSVVVNPDGSTSEVQEPAPVPDPSSNNRRRRSFFFKA